MIEVISQTMRKIFAFNVLNNLTCQTFKFIKIIRNKSYKLKNRMRIKLKKSNFINYLN